MADKSIEKRVVEFLISEGNVLILFFDNVKFRNAGNSNNALGMVVNPLFEAENVRNNISFSIPAGNSLNRLPSMPSECNFFNWDNSGNEVNCRFEIFKSFNDSNPSIDFGMLVRFKSEIFKTFKFCIPEKSGSELIGLEDISNNSNSGKLLILFGIEEILLFEISSLFSFFNEDWTKGKANGDRQPEMRPFLSV